MKKLKGPCPEVFLRKEARRRVVVYRGPLELLGGDVGLLTVEEGLSDFGAPTPEALEYCVPGLGRYARRLDPPFMLDELAEEVPPELRGRVEESRCVKYAFYTSRADPRPLRPGIYATTDSVLFFNLGLYFPLYTADGGERRCGADPLTFREVRLRVMGEEEFLSFLYWRGVMKTARDFLWKLPVILFKLRRRVR